MASNDIFGKCFTYFLCYCCISYYLYIEWCYNRIYYYLDLPEPEILVFSLKLCRGFFCKCLLFPVQSLGFSNDELLVNCILCIGTVMVSVPASVDG